MKKWTELEDKLILDSIPEDGVAALRAILSVDASLNIKH